MEALSDRSGSLTRTNAARIAPIDTALQSAGLPSVPRGCTSRGGLLLRESQLREDERPLEGGLVQVVVTARGAPVSRGHIRLQEERIQVGLQSPQARHVLRGLVVEDLTVVERRHDEHRGIRALPEVLVRAVGPNVLVLLLPGGVPP